MLIRSMAKDGPFMGNMDENAESSNAAYGI